MEITKKAFNDLIQIERNNQDKKWGPQHHNDEKWLTILMEEVGEAAKAVLEKDEVSLFQEVVQIGAVLEAWVTSRDFFFQEIEELDTAEPPEIQHTDPNIRQHFVVLDEKFKVLLKGHIGEQRDVTLTFRYNAPEREVSEQYSSFDVILNMIPPGTLPTIQFGDEATVEKFL